MDLELGIEFEVELEVDVRIDLEVKLAGRPTENKPFPDNGDEWVRWPRIMAATFFRSVSEHGYGMSRENQYQPIIYIYILIHTYERILNQYRR